MKVIECVHKEQIIDEEEYNTGTCSICGQITEYSKDAKSATVTKLGRLGPDTIVVPKAGFKLGLDGKDTTDLAGLTYKDKFPEQKVGRQKQMSPDKSKPDIKAHLKWYREHKLEMIADLKQMSREEFLDKWKVSRQTISHLKSDPAFTFSHPAPLSSRRLTVSPIKAAVPIAGDGLPPLPAFSDSWPEAVQIRWLGTYEALALRR